MIDLSNQNVGRNAEINTLNNYKKTLEERSEAIREEFEGRDKAEADNRASLERIETEIAESSKVLEREKEKIFEIAGNILSSTRRIEELNSEIKEITDKSSRAAARRSTIEEMEANYEGYNNTVRSLMQQHLSLAANVINSDSSFREDSVTSIVSSMICLVAGLWADRINELREEAAQTTTRSRMVLEQFIRLVGQYHTKYRNVGFYADKLCLTPKYLSKLIKTASGKSAPEWIDSYVILEAKNLLKYSDIAIKEIVYRLNFPNQSVFYKFFKARTGMTPSEYRNS
jgi:AraC-like DNA-binding protein